MWPNFLQFGSASMLWWSCAAAIPIVLHWWGRRHRDTTEWAAMELLQTVLKQRAARLRIEQRLLLTVRVLALLLLAIALADPRQLLGLAASTTPEPLVVHHVVVIDASMSMAFRDRDRSRLEEAQAWAEQFVVTAPLRDVFSVIVVNDDTQLITAPAAFVRSEIVAAIREVEQSYTVAVLENTVDVVMATITAVDKGQVENRDHRVHFLTDLQARSWNAVTESPGREQMAELGRRCRVRVVDVGSDASVNWSVNSLRSLRQVHSVGDMARVRATIHSYPSRPKTSVVVQWKLDGRVHREESLTSSESGTIETEWTVPLLVAGDQILSLSIADDSLQLDNEHWIVLPVAERIRILFVADANAEESFIPTALAPAADPHWHIVQVDPTSRWDTALDEFDVVILSDVNAATADMATSLRRHVKRGGGLMWSLGPSVDASSYNEFLSTVDVELLPGKLLTVVGSEPQRIVPDAGLSHSILSPFGSALDRVLNDAPVWRAWSLQPAAQRDVVVAWRLSDGTPLVSVHPAGMGQVVTCMTALSATAMDRSVDPAVPWSALVTSQNFVPFVHGLTHAAMNGIAGPRSFVVGQPLVVAATSGSSIGLTDPQGVTHRLPVTSGGTDGWGQTPAARVPGVFKIATAVESRVAVNVDATESDLARLDSSLLPTDWSVLNPAVAGEGATASIESSRLSGDVSLFRYLLGFVMALLVMESLLTGRRSRRSP